MSDEGQPSYGRNVLISLMTMAVISVLSFANSVVIARAAGAEARGLYSLAVAIGALALPLAAAGLGAATTWQLGRGRPHAQLLSLTRRAGLIALMFGLSAAGVARSLFGLGISETTLWAVIAAALALPAHVVLEFTRGFLLGQRRALAYNLTTLVAVATLCGLNVYAWLTETPGQMWVLINLVVSPWVFALLLALLSLRRPSKRPEPELVRGSLTYGLRSALVALGDAALLRVDYIVAAPIVGLAGLGVYAVAEQISQLLSWAGLTAGRMLLPEAASDSEDGRRSLAKLALAVRASLTALLVGAVIVIVAGRWLIELLFGPTFTPAYVALLWLLPAALCKNVNALVATWLQGRGDQTPVVRANALAIVVEVAAVAGLALGFGWIGVAVAKSCAYALQFVLGLAAFRKHRASLPDDDGHLIPGGRWLLRPADLAILRRALSNRRASKQDDAAPDEPS